MFEKNQMVPSNKKEGSTVHATFVRKEKAETGTCRRVTQSLALTFFVPPLPQPPSLRCRSVLQKYLWE